MPDVSLAIKIALAAWIELVCVIWLSLWCDRAAARAAADRRRHGPLVAL